MAIIAVDLGTTNTVALFKEPNRRPIWVTEQNGLPSLAIKEGAKYRYTDNGMLYGTIRNAKRRLLIEHENITSLKWIDGKETLQVNRYNPQTEVNETDLQEAGWEVVHQVNYDVASVEEARNAIKTIVHEIRNRLEAHLARPLLENDEFIFSVPAQVTFYNQILREILLQDTWPINNFQVFPEPFAVLLEYLDGKIVPGSYLIMDIGGGTTDWIGIMIDDKQNFNQIFSFRQDVGGSDIDRVLLDLIVPNVIDDGIRSNLLYQIEQNKITVSQTQDKAIGVFHSFEWVLTYEHLLDIVQDVFSKYITEAYEQLRHYVFDYIILAGGGSLSPGLKKMVSKQFQRDVQQIDTERISYACAEGLIRAREQQDNIVSGLDQKVGYWDII
ncbi:Hsp70 family protein, partial [Sulfobacillus thermosulfidooxidans]